MVESDSKRNGGHEPVQREAHREHGKQHEPHGQRQNGALVLPQLLRLGAALGFAGRTAARLLRRGGYESTTTNVLYEVFSPFFVFLFAEWASTSGILAFRLTDEARAPTAAASVGARAAAHAKATASGMEGTNQFRVGDSVPGGAPPLASARADCPGELEGHHTRGVVDERLAGQQR